jgi:integrase
MPPRPRDTDPARTLPVAGASRNPSPRPPEAHPWTSCGDALSEVPEFIGLLRARQAISAIALEFAILTAARTGEVLGAQWGEIDLDAKVWTVPAARMKGGREHRVPLAPRAVAIIEAMAETRISEFVFPGFRKGRPLSDGTLDTLLDRMNVPFDVHGFRSAFRDWCGECTAFPREVAEAALAHVVGDATERAYRRGDALEKRRRLMDAWASYCETFEPRSPGRGMR